MNHKILLVDDEKDIVDLIEEVLRQDGFQNIEKAYTGEDAVEFCKSFEPDVIVLDIMLPDLDGIEVCKKIRGFSFCSILFLSSKNDDVNKILGLSSGGDDYITKPFSPREVVFRIKHSSAASNISPPSIPLRRKQLLRAAFSWTRKAAAF